MDVQDEQLWQRATTFLEDCKDTKTHIIHDYDTDGISGGLLVYHALDELGADVTASTRTGRGAAMHPDELARIRQQHRPDRLIITDQDPKSFGLYEHVRAVFPDADILIIDHHHRSTYEDALFIHPEPVFDVPGHQYCSAKLIRDLCAHVTDTTSYDWLACTGILGDMNTEHFEDFLEEVAEREGIQTPDDWYESAFAKINTAIDCCSAAEEEHLLRYVHDLKRCRTLTQALALENPCEEVKEEVDFYVQEAMDLAQTDGPVVWVPVESRYGIAGWVATIVSKQHPHRVFTAYREQVDGYGVSARYQDAKVHLGEILKEITGPLGGSGGGHAPAAGAWIPKDAWEAFREAFDRAVQERFR